MKTCPWVQEIPLSLTVLLSLAAKNVGRQGHILEQEGGGIFASLCFL